MIGMLKKLAIFFVLVGFSSRPLQALGPVLGNANEHRQLALADAVV